MAREDNNFKVPKKPIFSPKIKKPRKIPMDGTPAKIAAVGFGPMQRTEIANNKRPRRLGTKP